MFSSNMLGLDANPSAGLHPPSRYPPFFTNKPDVVASHSASFAVSDEVQSLRSYSLLKELCWFNMVLVFLHCNVAGPSSYIWGFSYATSSRRLDPQYDSEKGTQSVCESGRCSPTPQRTAGPKRCVATVHLCLSPLGFPSIPLWVPEALSLFGIKSISSYSDCTVAHGMLLLAPPPPYLEV